MKGKYIIFEGPDGSGKSTLAKMLSTALQLTGQSLRSLAFPGRESVIGNLIRDSFERKVVINPEAMMWLFVAEGKDMEPQIRRHITEGDWIVCDRHTMISGLVYQGKVHGLERVDVVTQPANFIIPDRIYLVDVPAKVSLERRAARGGERNVLYEPVQIEQVEAQCKAYRDLRERFASSVILDGAKPLEQNLRWVWQDLGLLGEPPMP
jgi:dTMP kinase